MSFGKMTGFAEIKTITHVKDSEGFTTETEVTVAAIRVFREGRHGSSRWANLASFSEATDLFRFRVIPGVTVTTDHFIVMGGERYDIVSAEDIRGRGMYQEVLAKKVVSSIG